MDFSARKHRDGFGLENIFGFLDGAFSRFLILNLGTAPIFEYIRPTLMVTSTPKYPEV